MKKINCIKKGDIRAFIESLRKDELLESSEIIGNKKFIIITMEEDIAIIKSLWKFFSDRDSDILEYSLHSNMIEDDDGNFITTLKFQIIRFEN